MQACQHEGHRSNLKKNKKKEKSRTSLSTPTRRGRQHVSRKLGKENIHFIVSRRLAQAN